MTATEDGSELVNVRKVWKDEALHFTPWLAKNLNLLGEALGMKLEEVQQEAPIGSFSLDILAREANRGVIVAIENQLEETDLTHLGQLLTYATGCGAHIAIWVAPYFGYEHAQALHRLNEWSSERIRFYGVKVEVLREEGSELTPRLRKVVYPGGWDKNLTLRSREMPPTTRKYYDFFQPLIAELPGAGFAERVVQRFGPSDRHFPSPLNDGIWYAASLEGANDAWVTLHIEMGDQRTNRIFDKLKVDKEQIEKCIEDEWHWRRHDSHSYSSINIRRDASIDDPPDKLEETRAWMLDLLPKLKKVFYPRLAEILRKSPESG